MNILLTNSHALHNKDCEYNLGSDAVISSAINILRKHIPDAKFMSAIQLSENFALKNNVSVIKLSTSELRFYSLGYIIISSIELLIAISYAKLRKISPNLAQSILNKKLKMYEKSDLIVDLSMDTFSNDFGTIAVIEHCKDILLGKSFDKPIFLFAQSLGPFNNPVTCHLAKYCLNKVNLISARENISLEIIKNMGVSTPIYLTADPAFLLPPIMPLNKFEDVEKFKPFIGLTISSIVLIHKSPRSIKKFLNELLLFIFPERFCRLFGRRLVNNRYALSENRLNDFSEIIDKIIDKLNINVVLIPHTIIPFEDHPLNVIDDRYIEAELFRRCKNQSRILLINKNYSSNEIKWIIGKSELFIGSKMHSNIAALSQGVPTIAISYSHKFNGIMGSLGLEGYICSMEINEEEILAKIDDVWPKRNELREQITRNVERIKMLSDYNGELANIILTQPHMSEQ